MHLTLYLLSLNESNLKDALETLNSFQPTAIPSLEFSGLRTFQDRVIYANPTNASSECLLVMVNRLKAHFASRGFQCRANRDEFVPHLTLIKGRGIVPFEVYARWIHLRVSCQPSEIRLCVIGGDNRTLASTLIHP